MIDANMIKALRCIASQDKEGDCYKTHENFKHLSDENWKPIVCREGECVRDFISGREGVTCPYFQQPYGVCAEDGELWWLKDLADEIEKEQGKVQSHSEEQILKQCICLMNEMVDEFAKWYEWVHGENAIAELDEEERFCIRKSYFSIVQQLFLYGTSHSGGTSTCKKCSELGVADWSDDIEFGFELEEEE